MAGVTSQGVVAVLVAVVGANGQLGSRCAKELVRRGHHVRGLVRRADRAGDLAAAGVDVVEADPAAATGLREALDGVDAVVLTANSATPRPGDAPAGIHRDLRRVVTDAGAQGVRRFCFVSTATSPLDEAVPLGRSKRELERLLRDGPMQEVVLRFPPFMEVWLALVGSSVPVRAESHATVNRPSPFMRQFRTATGRLVEERGVMLVPGSPRLRNAFIAVPDAARACAEAVERQDVTGVVDVGGPEVLSWQDVAAVYADVLGRRVRILSTPGPVYAALSAATRRVAPVPSAVFALNRLVATLETPWSPGGGGLVDPSTMTTVRELLETKAALPAEVVPVP
jgi:uncharacterized protein YbjT (DUF2867 family)